MKPGFILVFIVLGTFICSVTHAAPITSEVQQFENDDDLVANNKELLKLLDQIKAKSQQDDDDDDDNDDGDQINKNAEAEIFKRLLSKHSRGILSREKSAQAEFFKKLFRKVKKGFKKIGGKVKKGFKKIGGGLFRRVSGLLGLGGGGCGGGYKKLKQVAKLQVVVSKMQQDGDIDTANAQFYTALLGGLGRNLLSNLLGGGGGGCKTAELQEYFVKTQQDDDDDDDGSEVQAQNDDLLNELEDLAAEQQEDDEDGDTALTEVEDQQAQDDNDDDDEGSDAYAELQGRRRQWRGRNSRKWMNRRRGPKRRRNKYRRPGQGGWSRRLGQLGGGLLSGYLRQRAYGGLGGTGGGYPPSMMPGGMGGYGYQPNMVGYPPEMGAGGFPPGLGGLPGDILQQLGLRNNGAAVIENSDDDINDDDINEDDINDDDDGDIQAFLSSILES